MIEERAGILQSQPGDVTIRIFALDCGKHGRRLQHSTHSIEIHNEYPFYKRHAVDTAHMAQRSGHARLVA